jgi:hypothetical protein
MPGQSAYPAQSATTLFSGLSGLSGLSVKTESLQRSQASRFTRRTRRTAKTAKRKGIACGGSEIAQAEAGDALIVAGRVEHAYVESHRLADPVRQHGVIVEIVIGQRMDERA